MTRRQRDGRRPPHNLRPQPAELLGRQRELDQARETLLASPPVRLLTLTGPGGAGKTRLALEIARELLEHFADGVFVVDLVPLRDARFIDLAIARAVCLEDRPNQPIDARVVEFLHLKRLLLVLDNFEHLADGRLHVASLLEECPDLKILVTSRARLGLRWEHVVPVPPLALPELQALPDLEQLGKVPSVKLVVQRARAIDPTFTLSRDNAHAVSELCIRLDGLPLALELAAARIVVLSPQMILERLDHPLDVLAGGAADMPSRHVSLRRAVAWSYELLSPDDQALFRRIALFAGGCLPNAVAAVANRDVEGLTVLASNSLIRRELQRDGQARFHMLETIRAFAFEQLVARDELDEIGHRFRDFVIKFAEEASCLLTGPEHALWLDRLELEHDNLRACLQWCIDHGEAAEALRLASALWRFWFTRRHLTEGSRWLDECLALDGSRRVSPELRARALNGAGNLAHARGDLRSATRLHEAALAVRTANDDQHGIAISLNSLANVAVDLGNYALARELHERSLTLRRELNDERGIAVALNNLGVIARDQEQWQRAADLSRESAALFRKLEDGQGEALALVTLGAAEYRLGSHDAAVAMHRQALAVFRETDNNREIAHCLQVVALLVHAQAQPVRAARLFGAAEFILEQVGSSFQPSRSPHYERAVANIREMLGGEAFDSAWAEGRAMRPDRAIEEALVLRDTAVVVPEGCDPQKRRVPGLTRREQEVLVLLMRGLTNREIASELTIAERTAETHVCTILNKLSLHRRSQLTTWAIEHQLDGQPRVTGFVRGFHDSLAGHSS